MSIRKISVLNVFAFVVALVIAAAGGTVAHAVGSPPSPPSALTATPGQNNATISWSNPVSSFDSVTVTVSPGGQTYTGTGSVTVFNSLNAGVTYTVSAYATGSGENSTTVTTTVIPTAGPATVPAPPTGVTATAGVTQITVNWAADGYNGNSTITGFTATATGGATCTAGPTATSCVITGLTAGSSYSASVIATNSVGSSSASVSSSAVSPSQPPATDSGLPSTGVDSKIQWFAVFGLLLVGGTLLTIRRRQSAR